MTDHNPHLIIDPNLTSFPAASLRRALSNCGQPAKRRLAQFKTASGHQSIVTIAAAHITACDGNLMTITPDQMDEPPADATIMRRPAKSVTLDIIRRDADPDEDPVPVDADLLMFGWPGNEVVIPVDRHWAPYDRLLLTRIIREAAMQYGDGDPFWQADSAEYADRAKDIAETLLAD